HDEADLDRVVEAVARTAEDLAQRRLGTATPVAAPRTCALTPAQRQVWVHTRLGREASLAYNEMLVLRLRGALDGDALRAAVQGMVDRHESLRTTFDPDG